MSKDIIEENKKLSKSIEASLRKAERIVADFRKTNNRIVITSIVSSGTATLVAGLAAALGEGADIGTDGWRTACIIAAIFGFVSTVTTGISQQLKISDRLSEGKQCVGKLRYLNVATTTGRSNWEEISKEYEETVKTFPDFIA